MKNYALLPGILILSACCTQPPESRPSSLSLGDSVKSIQKAVLGIDDSVKKAGLITSKATVNLVITASKENSNELKLELAPIGVIKEVPSGSFDSSNKSTYTTGNTITIEFQSIYTASKDSVLGLLLASNVLTSETTTVKDGGKETTTTKTPVLTSLLTPDQFVQYLEKNSIVMFATPPAQAK